MHRHLEGSIPFPTLQRSLSSRFIDVDAAYTAAALTKPMKNLQEVLDHLDIFQSAFTSVDETAKITKDGKTDLTNSNNTQLYYTLSMKRTSMYSNFASALNIWLSQLFVASVSSITHL